MDGAREPVHNHHMTNAITTLAQLDASTISGHIVVKPSQDIAIPGYGLETGKDRAHGRHMWLHEDGKDTYTRLILVRG